MYAPELQALRQRVPLALSIEAPRIVLRLEADDLRNLDDVKDYLRAAAQRPAVSAELAAVELLDVGVAGGNKLVHAVVVRPIKLMKQLDVSALDERGCANGTCTH